jgi:hypothetical protein
MSALLEEAPPRIGGLLAYEMKMNKIHDPNYAQKNGHVVPLSEGLQVPPTLRFQWSMLDTMRVSSPSRITR